VDRGLVAHAQLVEAGRHAAVLFEQVDAALCGVALLVALGVERWRPATFGPELAPVTSLVVLDRDDAPDPASAQVRPVTRPTESGWSGCYAPFIVL